MKQEELNRAVAEATGEDLCEIQHRGFGLADPIEADFDPEPYVPPQIVDWDELELHRNVAIVEQPQSRRAA